MQKDLRDRNSYFSSKEIHRFLKEYAGAMANALNKVSEVELENARKVLNRVSTLKGRIFVGGNGGSAAISDHLTCDFVKGTRSETEDGLLVHSLVGSQALFSAIANDLGYENTFSYQLEANKINGNDCLILISSSGNSPNIVSALKTAHSKNVTVIGLTGFSGGELFKQADVKLHIAFNNYGVVEDCHQAIMHVLAQYHYLSLHDRI